MIFNTYTDLQKDDPYKESNLEVHGIQRLPDQDFTERITRKIKKTGQIEEVTIFTIFFENGGVTIPNWKLFFNNPTMNILWYQNDVQAELRKKMLELNLCK